MDADDARAAAERAAKQRNTVFEAFTRQEATPTGAGEGAPGVVRMLRSLYSTTRSVKAEGGAERMITSISSGEYPAAYRPPMIEPTLVPAMA